MQSDRETHVIIPAVYDILRKQLFDFGLPYGIWMTSSDGNPDFAPRHVDHDPLDITRVRSPRQTVVTELGPHQSPDFPQPPSPAPVGG